MGIRRIDYGLCSGCGTCVEYCPLDVIRMNEETGKPFIMYLSDCMACFLCEVECPEEAIYVSPDRERRTVLPW